MISQLTLVFQEPCSLNSCAQSPPGFNLIEIISIIHCNDLILVKRFEFFSLVLVIFIPSYTFCIRFDFHETFFEDIAHNHTHRCPWACPSQAVASALGCLSAALSSVSNACHVLVCPFRVSLLLLFSGCIPRCSYHGRCCGSVY